jgi:DNA-binding winged helix-turn-helix (wHTH) protein
MPTNSMNSLQFGAYILNPIARELRRGEELIPLPAKVFDLLTYMAQNPRRPLLKSEIMAAVWSDSYVEESNLNQNIFLLRRALAPDGDSLIVTLPRKGYQFTGKVQVLAATASFVLPAAPAASAPAPEPAPRPRRDPTATSSNIIFVEEVAERAPEPRSPRRIVWLALAVVVVLALAWLILHHR